jgi:glutamate/tyrosine decarboxylase-like PLP-dependent enzyme
MGIKMKDVQKKMFLELADKKLFEKVHELGFEYLNEALTRNVFPTKEAIGNLKFFEEQIPERGSNPIDIINRLHQFGAPATVSQIGGRYFGFVCGSVVPAGLAAKGLATYWDQNAAMHVMSPLISKLETIVEAWLKSIFNLPENVVAGFVSGTTTANLTALAAARYRLLKNQNWDVNKKGLANAPKVKIVAGRQAHSSVYRALNILGFGEENIHFVDSDDQGRIIPELIPPLDNSSLLILQAGNVNTGSFDNFKMICAKAKQAGAWTHVDGAFGLWAAATSMNHLTNGMEDANSWAADAHKTLNTPYDSGVVLCNDKEALLGALQTSGAYLALNNDREGMLYTPEMSRRSRIIELWATLKYLGKDGLNEMVTTMHDRALQFANELKKIPEITILNDVVFNQVLLKCKSDVITDKVIANVQEQRVCWVGGSQWKGEKAIRISVCSWATTEEDVSLSVESFRKAMEENQ